MALKPTRVTVPGGDSVASFMTEVAERGSVVIWGPTATGSLGGLDDPNSSVRLPTNSGGVPVGILMNDVVNKDLTRLHLNQHKDEVQVNGKVAILKQGTIQTNMIFPGISPVAGSGAYYTTSGLLTTSVVSTALVGKFASAKDADGYVVVDVRL